MMQEFILKLKSTVISDAANPSFIHHAWFVTHHLSIIEEIVEELLVRYPAANKTVCRAMVWVHDWGKIVTNKGPDEENVNLHKIQHDLPAFGFPVQDIQHIQDVYEEMESLQPKSDDFLIETKIISSADAYSHYIGPFMALFWYENPTKSIDDLIASNISKIKKDEAKILLADVKQLAAPRMALIAEYLIHQREIKKIMNVREK